MKPKSMIGLLILFAIGLAACSSFQDDIVAETVNECPIPTDDARLLRNDKHHYCLLYPNGLDVFYPNEYETVLIVDSLLNVEDPRVYIQVHPASGRTVQQLADGILAEIPAGFDVQRNSLTLDGQTAVTLDNLPGQDLNRKVLVVYQDRFFQFMFVPTGTDYGELSARTEQLYEMVIKSFQFISETADTATNG